MRKPIVAEKKPVVKTIYPLDQVIDSPASDRDWNKDPSVSKLALVNSVDGAD